MSIFSSNLNVLQAWNSCLGVFPILEYCHLNLFCNAGQSLSNGANVHTIAWPHLLVLHENVLPFLLLGNYILPSSL